MDTYRDSDSAEYHSRSENESDYVINCYDNLTLEEEILRGTKIREAKPRTYRNQSAYDAIDIDFATPFCATNKKRKTSTSPSKAIEIRTNPCSRRSFSPNGKSYSPMNNNMSKTSSPQTRPKLKKCSMRIAELAVPSKRQCIETWREKWNVLPGFMVDRLKQQIMDQTPVVHISDAIDCFKKGIKRCTEKNNYESWKKIDSIIETRTFCATFAHKVAQKLLEPRNISLNPQLQRLSKVVAMNIADIIKNGKDPMDKLTRNRILMEISNKVTLWISTVLDDLSDKLLEEDLRAQRNTNRRLQKDVHLVTLIEKILNQESSELEEEEGPVLDIMDDLVDNVVDTCDRHSSDFTKYHDITSDNNIKNIHIDQQQDDSALSDSIENNNIDAYTDEKHDTILNDTTEILVDDENVVENELFQLAVTSGAEDKLMDNLIREDFKEDINSYFKNEINNVDTRKSFNDKKQSEIPEKWHDSINTEIKNMEQTNKDRLLKPEIEYVENSNEKIQIPLMTEVEDVSLNGDKIFDSELTTKPIIELDKERLENDLNYEIDELKTANTNLSVSDVDANVPPAVEDHGNYNIAELHENTLEIKETGSKENSNEVDRDLLSKVEKDFTNTKDNLNVSEVFQIHSEESPDDKNKKVKFSHIDMVTLDNKALPTVSSTKNLHDDISNEQEQISWKSSSEYIKPFMLGPLNEGLLSDADELWPGDIPTPTIKVSDSASRSVTSLGKIIETDEKILMSPDNTSYLEQNTQKLVKDTVIVEKNYIDPEIVSITNDAKINKTNMAAVTVRENPIRHLKESSNTTMLQEEPGNNILHQANETKQTAENEINKLIINASEESKSKKKNASPYTNIETFQNELADTSNVLKVGDHIQYNAQSEENILLQTAKDNIKFPRVLTKAKFNYKVNPNTAQSWVPCGNGEPSEDSFNSYTKDTQNIKECNYQKWCNDLKQGFVNLEIWNNWIDNACKMIAYIEQTKDIKINSAEVTKNWINLKKSINRDAILWKKLNQRAHERLKIYKNIKKSKIRQTKSCRNRLHQQILPPHQMERTCTCIQVHHGPSNPVSPHLKTKCLHYTQYSQ